VNQITHTTLNILKNWNQSVLNDLISLLNKQSIVSDEDGTGLSSTMVEGWNSDCCSFLKKNGYKGEDLSKHALFFEGHGAVYVLYDSNNGITQEDAESYMKEIASCN